MPSNLYKDTCDYNHIPGCPWENAWPPIPVGHTGCHCGKHRDEWPAEVPTRGEVLLTVTGVAVAMLIVVALMALADRYL